MAQAYYIPSGPQNLASLFPLVDWNNVAEYYIQVTDTDDQVVATSPMYAVMTFPDQYVRLYFLTYLGCFDACNFFKPNVQHEATDSQYQKGLNDPLDKTDSGYERFNVRANDTYTTTEIRYPEASMLWLQELLDSPKAYMEWEGIQGQADSFLPIVIIEAKFDKLKRAGEFRYEFPVKFKLANEVLTIRN